MACAQLFNSENSLILTPVANIRLKKNATPQSVFTQTSNSKDRLHSCLFLFHIHVSIFFFLSSLDPNDISNELVKNDFTVLHSHRWITSIPILLYLITNHQIFSLLLFVHISTRVIFLNLLSFFDLLVTNRLLKHNTYFFSDMNHNKAKDTRNHLDVDSIINNMILSEVSIFILRSTRENFMRHLSWNFRFFYVKHLPAKWTKHDI